MVGGGTVFLLVVAGGGGCAGDLVSGPPVAQANAWRRGQAPYPHQLAGALLPFLVWVE